MPKIYYAKGGDDREYGPVSLQTLNDWTAEGRLRPTSLIRIEGSEEPVPLSSIEGWVSKEQFESQFAEPQPAPPTYASYPREEPVAPSNPGGPAFWWSVADNVIALITFFGFGGWGVLWWGFGAWNAYLAHRAGHKWSAGAIVLSAATFVALAVGFSMRK